VVVVKDTYLPFELNDLCNKLYYFVARKQEVQVRCIYIVKDEKVNHCFCPSKCLFYAFPSYTCIYLYCVGEQCRFRSAGISVPSEQDLHC
jgi:hypothetical protein